MSPLCHAPSPHCPSCRFFCHSCLRAGIQRYCNNIALARTRLNASSSAYHFPFTITIFILLHWIPIFIGMTLKGMDSLVKLENDNEGILSFLPLPFCHFYLSFYHSCRFPLPFLPPLLSFLPPSRNPEGMGQRGRPVTIVP